MSKKLLSKYLNTMRLGQNTLNVFFPKNIGEFIDAIKRVYNTGYILCGGGSNIIFGDNFSKSVINTIFMNSFFIEKNDLIVCAGLMSSFLSLISFILNIKGFEFLHLLPGTLGGAIFMNARCYDGEVSGLNFEVESVAIKFNAENKNLEFIFNKRKNNECDFSYKNSIFQKNNEFIYRIRFINYFKNDYEKDLFFIFSKYLEKYIIKKFNSIKKCSNLKYFYNNYKIRRILEIVKRVCKLEKFKKNFLQNKNFNIKDFLKERESIYNKMLYIENDRVNKRHFKYFSAGSVFKNNYKFGIPTGKIIDELGYRGYKINKISVSPYHGNIIINLKDGKFQDLETIINLLKNEVNKKYGFIPEEEIILLK
ncbi:MAG: hypothetical protein N3A58_04665 [Spirochaetes bacterium]|nr:hypothetical protein [Spirochaetota bacterium]